MSGYDLFGASKLNAIKDLGEKITKLDENIQKQSRVTTNLTVAMYFLSGVGILLMVVQIILPILK